MSVFGALPFVFSGDIPNYLDALFETVSGFTTTGASILSNPERLSRSCMFWRLFSHWIGGMGVLVFIAAILPVSGDHYIHIMRAEVPGPTVSKLVPRVRKTARILYMLRDRRYWRLFHQGRERWSLSEPLPGNGDRRIHAAVWL